MESLVLEDRQSSPAEEGHKDRNLGRVQSLLAAGHSLCRTGQAGSSPRNVAVEETPAVRMDRHDLVGEVQAERRSEIHVQSQYHDGKSSDAEVWSRRVIC